MSRLAAAGDGMTIGGRVFLALASSRAAERLARQTRTVLVTGTNGKTTTTALIARAASTSVRVATNRSGSNLEAGLFAAIVEATPADLAVLEVDELVLPTAMRRFEPDVVVALNLSRDQLDRVQEVRRIALKWSAAFAAHRGVVVANADDPLVVWAVRPSIDVIWVAGGRSWTADASLCPECSSLIVLEESGGWRCSRCRLRRPTTSSITPAPPTALPGRCNEANAQVALAVLRELGLERGAEVWRDLASVAGRYGHCTVAGRDVRLVLAKNPAGWLEALDLIDDDRDLVFALNARTQDGADPSWIWDVPFERLRGRTVACVGERAADLAVRVGYAGMAVSTERDVVAAVMGHPPGPIDVVANYSAFRDACRRLGSDG